MKTSQQFLSDVVAVMADVWLTACDRRVIVTTLDQKFVVVDLRKDAPGNLFGPASADECRLFIHRAAALDVLRVLGTERVAGAALMAADGVPHAPHALNS